jgi:hypothetical protein
MNLHANVNRVLVEITTSAAVLISEKIGALIEPVGAAVAKERAVLALAASIAREEALHAN